MLEKIKAVSIVLQNNEGKFLGVSRKNDHTLFDFPGGKVDPGETLEQALVRELKEETGLNVFDLKLVYEEEGEKYYDFTYVGQYEGLLIEEIQPNEGLAKWVTKEQIINGAFGAYNTKVLQILKIIN